MTEIQESRPEERDAMNTRIAELLGWENVGMTDDGLWGTLNTAYRRVPDFSADFSLVEDKEGARLIAK